MHQLVNQFVFPEAKVYDTTLPRDFVTCRTTFCFMIMSIIKCKINFLSSLLYINHDRTNHILKSWIYNILESILTSRLVYTFSFTSLFVDLYTINEFHVHTHEFHNFIQESLQKDSHSYGGNARVILNFMYISISITDFFFFFFFFVS